MVLLARLENIKFIFASNSVWKCIFLINLFNNKVNKTLFWFDFYVKDSFMFYLYAFITIEECSSLHFIWLNSPIIKGKCLSMNEDSKLNWLINHSTKHYVSHCKILWRSFGVPLNNRNLRHLWGTSFWRHCRCCRRHLRWFLLLGQILTSPLVVINLPWMPVNKYWFFIKCLLFQTLVNEDK